MHVTQNIVDTMGERLKDRGVLSMLKDFYFDAKYPGDNFVVVDREICEACLDTMYDCIREVHKIREEFGFREP